MNNIKKNVEQFNKDVNDKGGYLYNEGLSGSLTRNRIVNAWKELYDFHGKNVLDIGCGDGKYTMELYKLIGENGSILGIDASEKAIESANNLLYKNIVGGGVKFKVGNIYDIPFEKTFDCITITGVLHHLSEPEKAILEISKFSNTIVCMEPNGYNPALKILEKVSKYHIEHEEQSFFMHTIEKWFNKAGFKVKKVKYIDVVPMMCPDIMAKILNKMNPFFENIPLLKQISCGRIVILAEKIK